MCCWNVILKKKITVNKNTASREQWNSVYINEWQINFTIEILDYRLRDVVRDWRLNTMGTQKNTQKTTKKDNFIVTYKAF